MSLDHAALQAALNLSPYRCELETFDQLPSTSEYLALVTPGEHGAPFDAHIVACDWQTQGSGRRGKSWDTAPGNITFSVKTRAPLDASRLLGLSLVTGISVAEALNVTCQLPVLLKWPNDVIAQESKLCGLLTELQSNSFGTTVISGIGINVLENDSVKELGIGGISLSELSNEVPSREMIIAKVVTNLLENYNRFYSQGWSAFSAKWAELDYLAGKTVTVYREQQEQNAIVVGVADDGALLINDNGHESAIYSGDVSVRVS